jgi:hypothetical protein
VVFTEAISLCCRLRLKTLAFHYRSSRTAIATFATSKEVLLHLVTITYLAYDFREMDHRTLVHSACLMQYPSFLDLEYISALLMH